MSPHIDILEQPDSLKRPFWLSVIFHVSVAGVLVLYAGPLGNRILIGTKNPGGGGLGSAVTVQPIVALPSTGGRINPVANRDDSQVPAPPPKTKVQPKVKEPRPDAIALKGAKKNPSRPATSEPNKFQEKQQYASNQIYSSVGQKLTSPLVGMQGAGVGPGENSPFGTQFGWYAARLQSVLAQNWRTAGIDARTQRTPAVVVFRILRDGSLASGSAKVTQSSGNRALDDSALRAVLDSFPFSPLPPGFPQSQAECEFRFELRR